MRERNELLRAYQDEEDRLLAARALDKVTMAEKNWSVELGDFCDPAQAGVIRDLIRRRSGEGSVAFWGGYPDAERTRPAFARADQPVESDDYEIMALRLQCLWTETVLTHRDYLGAILALGIKREKIGDLIVDSEGCTLIATREIGVYLINNLTQVHRASVAVSTVGFEQLADYKPPCDEKSVVVASLRLDAVAAAAFGLSRSEMVREIEGRKIKLNWKECVSVAQEIELGDVLSMRGQGRAIVRAIGGETKKGRVRLTIARPK
ncbi:MAG: RNA-binding protein [Bacillota bacterium]